MDLKKIQDWASYFQNQSKPVSVQLAQTTLLEHFWLASEDNMFLMRLDEDGEFVAEDINPAQANAIGLSPDKILNQKMKTFLGEALAKETEAKYHNCLRRDRPVSYYEGFPYEGKTVYFNTTLVPVTDEHGTKRIIGISRDLSELLNAKEELESLNKQLEQAIKERTAELAESNRQLQKQAYTDQLTGIGNRRYFFERVDLLLNVTNQNVRESSLIYLDLDLFKSINDNFGHHIGDQVLVDFSTRLQALIRPTDVLCRFGGEEFLILLPDTPQSFAKQVAQNILDSLNRHPFKQQEICVPFTTSIGLASSPIHTGSIDKLIQRADQALYKAKQAGRNRFVVYQDDNSAA